MINQSNQQERRRHRYESEWSISTANLPTSYSTDMESNISNIIVVVGRQLSFFCQKVLCLMFCSIKPA